MRGTKYGVLALLMYIVLVLLFYFIPMFKNGYTDLSTNPQDWGAFGSYVGGLVTPVAVMFALLSHTESMKQNKKEEIARIKQANWEVINGPVIQLSELLTTALESIESARYELLAVQKNRGEIKNQNRKLEHVPVETRRVIERQIEKLLLIYTPFLSEHIVRYLEAYESQVSFTWCSYKQSIISEFEANGELYQAHEELRFRLVNFLEDSKPL